MSNFDSLKFLNLPIWKYVIVGSGFLSIKWIREANDIDILVKKELRDSLIQKYPKNIVLANLDRKDGDEVIRFDDKWIEIFKDWIYLYWQENNMIDSADIINWLPFINSKYFKERKSKMGREKDIKDLQLLSEYEKNQK